MKIKTSLFVEESIWREIKKAAIDTRKTVGEFITQIFNEWRWSRNNANPANRKPDNTPGGAENRPDRS